MAKNDPNDELIPVTFNISKGLRDRLDAAAAKRSGSRSQVLRIAAGVGLDAIDSVK